MSKLKRNLIPGYPGIYYIEVQRIGNTGTEKIYYIRYRKNGKQIEEKVGREFRDNMTLEKAAHIRGLRIEGKILTNDETRKVNMKKCKKEKQSSINKNMKSYNYSLNQIFTLFIEEKKNNVSINDDKTRYNLYLANFIGNKTITKLLQADIYKILFHLGKNNKSKQTKKHVMTLLKRIINFAAQKKLVEFVPSFILLI